MSGIFKGLADGRNNVKPYSTLFKSRNIVLGQVLDVVLDEFSEYYYSPFSLGSIRVRLMPNGVSKPEDSVYHLAYPADRAHYKVPLPGEQVLLTHVVPATIQAAPIYVYFAIVSHDNTLSRNVNPFLGTSPFDIDRNELNLSVDVKSYAKRFEEKLQMDVSTYEQYGTSVQKTGTSLVEGDKIIEGRFGSSIKFTSTINNPSTEQLLFATPPKPANQLTRLDESEDGTPLTILKVNRAELTPSGPLTEEQSKTKKDNVDEDDASIYMASTQTIPMQIAASRSMLSWVVNPKAGSVIRDKDATQRAQDLLPHDESLLYDPNRPFTVKLNTTVLTNGGGGTGGTEQVGRTTGTVSDLPGGGAANPGAIPGVPPNAFWWGTTNSQTQVMKWIPVDSRTSVGRITSGQEMRTVEGTTRPHYGIDIGAAHGTPWISPVNGTVVRAGEATGYGPFCIVLKADADHTINGKPVFFVYGHSEGKPANIIPGAKVLAGQTVAYCGNLGHSFGAHLHFEVHIGSAFGTKISVIWYATQIPAPPNCLTNQTVGPGSGTITQRDGYYIVA